MTVMCFLSVGALVWRLFGVAAITFDVRGLLSCSCGFKLYACSRIIYQLGCHILRSSK